MPAARWRCSHEHVGDVLVAHGSLPEALRSYRDGLTVVERLANVYPGDAGSQRDLALPHSKPADT
jgi:hypothetical protein